MAEIFSTEGKKIGDIWMASTPFKVSGVVNGMPMPCIRWENGKPIFYNCKGERVKPDG